MSNLKKKRAPLRGKITCSINSVRKFIDQGAEMRKRIEKELGQIQKDFALARECLAEMYEYADEDQTTTMDDWKDILSNDYDVEESVEDFLASLSVHEHANATSLNNEQIFEQPANSNTNLVEPAGGDAQSIHEMPVKSPRQETAARENDLAVPSINASNTNISDGDLAQVFACNSNPEERKIHVTNKPVIGPKPKANHDLSSPQLFDGWVDNLVEFEETVLPN